MLSLSLRLACCESENHSRDTPTEAEQGAAPDRLQLRLWSQAPVAYASGGG